jgi:hypothetical protein
VGVEVINMFATPDRHHGESVTQHDYFVGYVRSTGGRYGSSVARKARPAASG